MRRRWPTEDDPGVDEYVVVFDVEPAGWGTVRRTRGRITMPKGVFIRLFKSLLEPEQVNELIGGYYDNDVMTVRTSRGVVHVYVYPSEVVVDRDGYDLLRACVRERRQRERGREE